MSTKNRAVTGVLIMIALFFIVLMIFAGFTMKVFETENQTVTKASIGIIEVNGVIMDSKRTVELLHKAEKDDSIKAIIMRINSPGGAVGPTQEIYEEIRRIDSAFESKKKSATKGKPIYASFGSIAASGGYYLGSACRRIYSSPGTLTGSIGVIMQFTDLSKLFEFAKVNPQPLKAGRYKDIGQPYRPITEEEKAMMGALLGGVHEQFITDIMKTRKERIKGDIRELAQGQIFSGELAYQYGLVDKLAGLWAAGREIHEELGLDGEFAFKEIKKKKKKTIWDILENVEEVSTNLNLEGLVHGTPVLMFK
ncbi:signal peptide peptidase SppA [Halobacteriovorax sp. GB3]|uniref:signal peptide peptidase SppA n=1 Tax=Halobacteriovorax sp. GB3 TaxID=2719615 RepID=UPI002362637A|nr:signal peptide peptidase SppA [Halobacteriovorax sp. GB3]MDD0853898.1 signal peptide peptidase SppA [Halobacteriovorax sp. GB3]